MVCASSCYAFAYMFPKQIWIFLDINNGFETKPHDCRACFLLQHLPSDIHTDAHPHSHTHTNTHTHTHTNTHKEIEYVVTEKSKV